MTPTASSNSILFGAFVLLVLSDRAAGHAISTQFDYASQTPVSIFNAAAPQASRPDSYRFGSSVSVTGGRSSFSTTSTDPYAYVDAYLKASYDVTAQYCFFNLCTSDAALVGVPLTGVAVDIADVISLSADAVDVDLVGSLKLTRMQSMTFSLGNVYSFDQAVSIETALGVRRARAGQPLLFPVAQEFFVTPLTADDTPHLSVAPYLRGTFSDSIRLSLCGGIEVDVLKASAGIVGLGEWSVGPLYSAEADLGCYEIARLSDTTYRLPDMIADSIEVLSLGEDVTLVAGALRAPSSELPPDEVLVSAPTPASALLLATGLLGLRPGRRKY